MWAPGAAALKEATLGAQRFSSKLVQETMGEKRQVSKKSLEKTAEPHSREGMRIEGPSWLCLLEMWRGREEGSGLLVNRCRRLVKTQLIAPDCFLSSHVGLKLGMPPRH